MDPLTITTLLTPTVAQAGKLLTTKVAELLSQRAANIAPTAADSPEQIRALKLWMLGLTLLGQGLEQVLNPRLETHHLMPGRPSVQSDAVIESAAIKKKSKRRKDAPLLLDVRNLSVNYISDDGVIAKAVHNVSLQLHEGELVGLVGESGCGKTTLMLALMRLLPAAGQIANGHINFRGKDLTTLNEDELQVELVRALGTP
jgi:ABC-type multidrug transport system fused ATPase/permease subunit